MLIFLERRAAPYYEQRVLLTFFAVCAFGGSFWLLKLAAPGSVLFRLALASAPIGFLPWNLAMLGAWFDPTRGILRGDGWLMRALPPPVGLAMRCFAGALLAGMLLATPVLIVISSARAIGGG